MVKRLALVSWLVLMGGCIVPLDVISFVDAGQADAGFEEDDGGTLTNANDISAGDDHSCAIVRGRIACWGANAYGQLGQSVSSSKTPVWLGSATDWKQVQVGAGSSCALKNDNSLWCWGFNGNGQLGNGSTVSTEVPQRVPLSKTVASFSLKFSTVCVVFTDATASCWGSNFEGQVGLQDAADSPDKTSPQNVGQSGWRSISTGQGHTCGIRTDGSLYCWGRNTDGELGLGDGAPNQERMISRVGLSADWVEVAAGQSTTCARKSSNALWCWGAPNPGTPSNVPIVVDGPADWSAIALNTFARGGLRGDGVWSNWGRNQEGQLGLGTYSISVDVPTNVGNGYTQLTAGRFHTCAILRGEAVCTGDNNSGQLGTGTGRINAPAPVLRPTVP